MLLLACAALAAQEPQTPVFRADVAMVRVDVQVTAGQRVVKDLTAADFVVFDEGKRQEIAYFGRESEALDVLLLLDVSGSVRRYLEEIASVAREALRQLAPGDRVAVMLFSRRSQVTAEFTGNFGLVEAELRQAAREEGLGSGTAINLAVVSAARYTGDQPQRGRRAVLIVTDNMGLNYQTPDEAVIRTLYEADCVLNAIVVGRGERPKPPKPGQYQNPDFTPSDVFKLAEETGGEAVKAKRADTTFREMIERLRTRYSIHYKAPEAEPDSFRRIRVELSPETQRRYRKAEVRARSGYYVRSP